MSSPKWSGTLKSKKKADLQDICRELNIEFRSDTLKADLEQNIQITFQQKPHLQSDARFEELITSSVNSNSTRNTSPDSTAPRASSRRTATSKVNKTTPASRASGDHVLDNDLDDEPKEDEINKRTKLDSKAATRSSPRRKSLVDGLRDSLPSSDQLTKAVGEAEKQVEHAIHHASSKLGSSQVTRRIKHASEQAMNKVEVVSTQVAEIALDGVQGTQYALSSPWNIWSLKIFAELSYVYYSLVPIDYQTLLHKSSNEYLVKLPNSIHAGIHLLRSAHFLRSLLEYSVLTIIAPLVIASLVNFAPPPNSRNSQGWVQRLTQLKPSPLTFSATRLAIVVLLHLVFRPSIRYGWPITTLSTGTVQGEEFLRSSSEFGQDGLLNCRNSQILGLEVLQFVMSAFGVTLGLHQLLSSSSVNLST